ncbi:IS21 family transposase [Oceanispirochaeta sp. M2]|nr:IS21 family transposase [Oceanispirochaeta sp. M2]
MLKMTEISNIRNLYFEEGKSITEIYRITGKDRKTIRTYIEKEDWNIAGEPLKSESTFTKLDPYKSEIDSWLTDDKKAKKKQRHTAMRVFNRLIEIYGDDFDCSYRTVAGYFSVKKKEIFNGEKGYIPLEHIAGEAQGDFGDADYYENGKKYSGKYLNLSFPHSNKGYFQLFKGENQECLFEGLLNIFEHIGGVPPKIWFDNTSTIVKRVLKNGGRDLTDDFLRFQTHYNFESVFCNPNAGHEKGNVEGKVGYHRRNMLVPVPRFNSLASFNVALLEKCEEDAMRKHYRKDSNIEELFSADRSALLPMPRTRLDVSKYRTVKTNKYGRFYLGNGLHEYSISPRYSGESVRVKITANEVIPLDDSLRDIVKHERLYGNHKQQSMKWLPYLKQLSRRPGALKYSGIYQLLPPIMNTYLERCDKAGIGQVLQMIATLTELSDFESAVKTVENALDYEVIDTDSLLNLHNRIHGDFVELPALKLSENVPVMAGLSTDMSIYDRKLKSSGVLI